MRPVAAAVLVVLGASAGLCAAPAEAAPVADGAVGAYGRPVQVDGFLMEWREADSRPLGGLPARWSALNTPAGLAGYVRLDSLAACRGAALGFVLEESVGAVVVRMNLDSSREDPDHVYAIVRGGSDGSAVAEFCVPWDALALDTAGRYAVRMELDCGRAGQASLRLHGNARSLLSRVVTPRIKVQTALILVLLAGYLAMSAQIRRRRRPAGSPHR